MSIRSSVVLILALTCGGAQAGCDDADPGPSQSCSLKLEITKSPEGLKFVGEARGYTLDRGNMFGFLDDDGQATLTTVFNVLATNGDLDKNKQGPVVIENQTFNLMEQAVDLGLMKLDPKDEQNPRLLVLRALRAALNEPNVKESKRLPKGFILSKLGPVLALTNDTDAEVPGKHFFAYNDKPIIDGAFPTRRRFSAVTQLCVNQKSGLRCGTGVLISGTGTNFCTRKFDTGEVYGTSQCPQGVKYELGAVPISAPNPAPGAASGAIVE